MIITITANLPLLIIACFTALLGAGFIGAAIATPKENEKNSREHTAAQGEKNETKQADSSSNRP